MRTIVIGLLPGQEKGLQAEFPHLDLRFLRSDQYRNADDAFSNADTIVAMTKFLDHGATYKMPREKVRNVYGGLTKLRSVLRTLNDTAFAQKISAAALEEPHNAASTATLPEEPEMAKKLSSDIAAMRALKDRPEPGTVIRVVRPASVPPEIWKARISARRTFYKNRYGVCTDVAWTPNGCDILVTKLEEEKPPRGRRGKTVADTTGTPPAVTVAPMSHVDYEADQWWCIFREALRAAPSNPPSWAADVADTALLRFRARPK